MKSKDPAVFYWRKDGDLAGVLALHVDDFMYAGSAKFLEEVMTKVKSEFLIKIEEKSAFTYLGLEIRQKAYYIEMDQKKYIEKLCPIDIPGGAAPLKPGTPPVMRRILLSPSWARSFGYPITLGLMCHFRFVSPAQGSKMPL